MSCLHIDIQRKGNGLSSKVELVNSLRVSAFIPPRKNNALSVFIFRPFELNAEMNPYDSGFSLSVCDCNSTISATIQIACYTNVKGSDGLFLTVADGFVLTIEGRYIKVLNA